MRKIFLFAMLFLFSISFISATCTVVLDKESYADGDTATASMICSAPAEQSKSYTLNWTNASGYQVHLDTGTTPAVKNNYFFDTYGVDSAYSTTYGTQLNVTLTGTELEGSDNSTIASAGSSDLIINDISIRTYYLNKYAAILFKVTDDSGNAISNAQCIIDVVNGDNLPIISSGKTIPTQGNGYVLFSQLLTDEAFEVDENYKWDLACTCFNTSSTSSNIPGNCYKEDDGTEVNEFKHSETQYPFTITDLEDVMVVNKTVDTTLETGIWLENAEGYRVNMTESLPLLNQEDINWSDYAQADGQAFLTAGEKFRVCMYANNTMDGSQHIKLNQLYLIKYPGHMIQPLCMDGSTCDDKVIMHLEIQEGNYIKCGDWVMMPNYIKGQNNYKLNFHLGVEGYDQEIELNSNRFTIFGERTDTAYIDYLTLNNVEFTKDNATEGEYVQLKLNVTNNHPFKNTKTLLHVLINTNEGGDEYYLELENYITGTNYGLIYALEKSFPNKTTSIILTPRIKIPYGLKDRALFDVIGAEVNFHILSEVHNGILWTQTWDGAEPSIDIIDYDLEITNITSTISNTQATACDSMTITVSYDNPVSDTAAKDEEDELFVMKGFIEDTTNDFYLDDIDIIFQPDQNLGDSFNFTTTVPYIGTSGTIESEIDIKFYTYDERNTDPDCTNCGELVFEYSGDDGDGTFNITANSADSCKYLKQSVTWEDDRLYNDYLSRVALEGIENKTGTFHFSLECPSENILGMDMSCTIQAEVEDSQIVEKEVDFTCYIWDSINQKKYSQLNFNQMVTRDRVTLSRDFLVPRDFSSKEEYLLKCEASYYNFGSRTDNFEDSFTVILMGEEKSDDGGGIIDKIKEKLDDLSEKTKDLIEDIPKGTYAFLFIVFGFLIICFIKFSKFS